MNRRRILIPVAIIVVLLVLAGVVYFGLIAAGVLSTPSFLAKQPAATPIPAQTRDGRWEQDVRYLAEQLPYLHVNAYHKTSEEAFQARAENLIAQIPTLNDEQIMVRLLELIALIGDGHTTAYPADVPVNYGTIPLEMMWLDGRFLVTGADTPYEAAIGTELIQVGDRPVQAVYDALVPLISADNQSDLINNIPFMLRMPSILYGLDLIPSKTQVTLTFRDTRGEDFPLDVTPAPINRQTFVTLYNKLGLQPPPTAVDRSLYYWYRHLPDQKVMYVQYNVCAEMDAKPMRAFVEEVFAIVDRENVERFILDVRYNGGGNQAVLNPMIEALKAHPTLNVDGRLFVFIGRGTFSSALQNAITLDKDTAAVLVGEPTGGKPNHYGEVRSFSLPNSGLHVQYATRYWRNYPDGDPLSLEPEIAAPPTIESVLSGRDPAFEAALR
ncbi:MAG: S41 family peptidase [Anaerolineae bacterium]